MEKIKVKYSCDVSRCKRLIRHKLRELTNGDKHHFLIKDDNDIIRPSEALGFDNESIKNCKLESIIFPSDWLMKTFSKYKTKWLTQRQEREIKKGNTLSAKDRCIGVLKETKGIMNNSNKCAEEAIPAKLINIGNI